MTATSIYDSIRSFDPARAACPSMSAHHNATIAPLFLFLFPSFSFSFFFPSSLRRLSEWVGKPVLPGSGRWREVREGGGALAIGSCLSNPPGLSVACRWQRLAKESHVAWASGPFSNLTRKLHNGPPASQPPALVSRDLTRMDADMSGMAVPSCPVQPGPVHTTATTSQTITEIGRAHV